MVDRQQDLGNQQEPSSIERYGNLPEIARWKVAVLEHGVDMDNKHAFAAFPDIDKFKTKRAVKSPTAQHFKFVDTSEVNYIIPSEVILNAGEKQSLVKLGYREGSPILLDTQDGVVTLTDRNTGDKTNIDLVKKRSYSTTRLPAELNPAQPPLEDFVQIVGMDRIGILAFEGCWYWMSNQACGFCDSNPKREGEVTGKPSLNTLSEVKFKEDKWWEEKSPPFLVGMRYALQYILDHEDISPHKHLQLMAGNLIKSEHVWEISRRIAAEINAIHPISDLDSYLNISPPTKNVEEELRSARDQMGFRQVAFNLEVYGEERFRQVCPGKARMIGYGRHVEALEKAVDIFGPGNVRTNFVLGAQPVEELLVGVHALAEKGIASDYSVFVPKKGTAMEGQASPDTKTVVDFTRELVDIHRKYGFKGIYCELSSRSNILHEMLEGE